MAPYMLALQRDLLGPQPRFVYDDHNAEYVLQQRAFATDVRRPKRWVAAGVLPDPVAQAGGV